MCTMAYFEKWHIPKPIKNLIFGQIAFDHTFADLQTHSSPDLILYSAVQSPSSVPSSGDSEPSASSPSPVVTRQWRKLH